MLEIIAGKNAYKIIQEHGLKQELFSHVMWASGGPKWFVLLGLDKYLFSEFFKDRKESLNVFGSSAGAAQSAAVATKNPITALTTLAHSYATIDLGTTGTTAKQMSCLCLDIIGEMLGASGEQEILENPIVKAHFIVAKVNGLVASENKATQSMGLVKSYIYNRVNRDLLAKQYQRFIFHAESSDLRFAKDPFDTKYQALNEDNLIESLLASGSIPIVMSGIRDIPHAPKGTYRDGGLIDYHFDVKLNNKGLILYPHFTSQPKAGWFDKGLERSINPENYSDVVMLCPSQEFIESLPYGKISDRTDFDTFDRATRISYWQTVLSNGEKLAEHFNDVVNGKRPIQIKMFE